MWRRRSIALGRLGSAGLGVLLIGAVTNGVAAGDSAFTRTHVVAGLSGLNVDGTANVDDISCTAVGNCGVTGTYIDGSGQVQGFVASESGGVWADATPIPGLAALNAGGAVRDSNVISCTAPGECTAGGRYTDAAMNKQAFVVDERGGTWGNAIEVPRDPSIPTTDGMRLAALACTSPGNCVAAGLYFIASGLTADSWVAAETSGTWAAAVPLPGIAALDQGQVSAVLSLSCPGAGACALTGYYTDAAMNQQVFVDDEVAGVWGTARALSGLVAMNVGGAAQPSQVSCSSAGNCAVGGIYASSANTYDAFVANEVAGVWGSPITLPGSALVNLGGVAAVLSLACPGDGSCEAVGAVALGPRDVEVMAISEVAGVWGAARQLPGMSALNLQGSAAATAVACVKVGDCRVVGQYTDGSGGLQSFVDTETGGVWDFAAEAPASGALNVGGNGGLDTVSCSGDGGCAAGGQYKDAAGFQQGMIVDASAPATTAPGTPRARAVSRAKGQITVTVHDATTGGRSISGYEYSLNGGPWRRGSNGQTTFVVSRLKSRSRIHLRVRALNAVGFSAASPVVTVRVL